MEDKLFKMIIDRFDTLEKSVKDLTGTVNKLSNRQSYNNGKRYVAYAAISGLISIVVVVASQWLVTTGVGV